MKNTPAESQKEKLTDKKRQNVNLTSEKWPTNEWMSCRWKKK